MSGAAVNRLIRSEIWPLLRAQGFTQFDARTAWRFSSWRTDVLNFQSFNTYVAESIGCTTYSFAVNLGVHLVGGMGERWIKQDKHGRYLPPEYACAFRTHLQKRTAVDGFARPDIFYVDGERRTTEAVFREARELVEDFGRRWFVEHSHPEPLIAATRSDCFAGAILLARVHLSRSPSAEGAARAELERAIGYAFEFSAILSDASGAEGLTDEICRHPLGPITGWGKVDAVNGSAWRVEVGDRLWPRLRLLGFQRFSKLVARREIGGILEIVEVVPMDNSFRKRARLPEGLFHVGLGWADRRREAFPVRRLRDCQIISWLRPAAGPSALAVIAFANVDCVLASLEQEGAEWLSTMANPMAAMQLLQVPDWDLFRRYPLMWGLGAAGSEKRKAILAGLLALAPTDPET